jgi:hypothetical protein
LCEENKWRYSKRYDDDDDDDDNDDDDDDDDDVDNAHEHLADTLSRL